MQIISGKYRGKKLKEYSDSTTRPTIGRIRESVFNVLGNMTDFQGSRVLDLFAGTGAYGLECFSRGAGEITFNDKSIEAVKTIRQNCDSVKCNALILNLDYKTALKKQTGTFDIIFLDPPYNSNFGEQAIEFITQKKLLSDNGVIIFETDKSKYEKCEPDFGNFDVKSKTYGRVRLYFLNQRLTLPR